MNSLEIKRALKQVTLFKGVFARDLLPRTVIFPAAFVANTDSSSEPGEHWISIFISGAGVGEYFDPFGLPPLHPDFIDFLNKQCKAGWTYSNVTIQDPSETICGQLSIDYIKGVARGETLVDFLAFHSKRVISNHY